MNASALARAIAEEAIASIDLASRVFEGLPPLPPQGAKVTVMAVGKGAPAMALGAIDRWKARIDRLSLVTTEGTETSPVAKAFPTASIMTAAHPLPDVRSVGAAQHLLEEARGGARDLALVLVSGGASSLVCAPPAQSTLDEKRALVAAMLDAGAPITEVNLVRRHFSRIKGGGLARAALPGRTLTLVASDVLYQDGDRVVLAEPWHVGSGPSTPDPSSVMDALRALERFAPTFAAAIGPRLTSGLPVESEGARRTRTKVVASPFDLAIAARKAAERRGLSVNVLPATLAPVDELAEQYARAARRLGPRSACVAVGEPSVRLPNESGLRGRGGRAGRLALATWLEGLPPEVAFGALASDGVDGSSGQAGAVVEAEMPESERARGREALARYDDAAFLSSAGCALESRATGLNLLDLHLIVRA